MLPPKSNAMKSPFSVEMEKVERQVEERERQRRLDLDLDLVSLASNQQCKKIKSNVHLYRNAYINNSEGYI